MFCHKCGAQIAEGAAFCHKCGTKVVHTGDVQHPIDTTTPISEPQSAGNESVQTAPTDRNMLRCPNCHSSDLIPITETRTDVSGGGYGVGKGCCGWILLGPFGLLCGLCGTGVKSRSRTLTFWVCKSCGTKFRSPSDIKADEAAESVETCASVLVGFIVLYVVGNLLSDNSIRFLGLPNWIFITLGVLGIILSTIGILGASTENMNESGEANMSARRTYLAALIASIASFIGGIIFAIAEVKFFWAPAWAYIVLGLLGAVLSAFMLTVAWALGATEDDGDLQFALIDLTGKDIPELVVESSGYFVKVFFYDGGEVLGGDTWAYGAAGNMGYEYLPGENLIRNFDIDYAGAVVYESYYGINFAHELSALPNDQLSIRYFRDANGNGYPDDDEPFLEEPLYYVGDSEVSKDVYASHQITGEFEWLGGDKSAEEMMVLLGVDYEAPYPQGSAVEFYYSGVSLTSLLGCAPVDLYNTLGAPSHGTPVTGDVYEGGEYYGYEGISFHIDYETNTVRWIMAAPAAVEVNGTTLEQTRSGLIELIGNPESEGNYYDELDNVDVYEMRYSFTGFELLIQMADINSVPYSILISSSDG